MKKHLISVVSVTTVLLLVIVYFVTVSDDVNSSAIICTRVLVDNEVKDSNAYLTPDGNWAVYIGTYNDSKAVIKKNLTTNTETVISGVGAEPFLEYSASILVNDDYVVWFDTRNGSSDPRSVDVYMADFSTNTEKRVTSSPADRRSLTLIGSYVAWAEYASINGNVYVADISVQMIDPGPIIGPPLPPPGGCATVTSSFISGNPFLIYDRIYPSPGYGQDICLYDIENETTTTIANSSNIERQGVCQNGVIYYYEYNELDDDEWEFHIDKGGWIKAYDISTQSTSTVTNFSSDDLVIIADNENDADYFIYSLETHTATDSYYLYAFDYDTSSTTTIESTNTIDEYITINSQCCYDDKIVYALATDNFNRDIYLFDISDDARTTICDNTDLQMKARIKDGRILWFDYYSSRDGGFSIVDDELVKTPPTTTTYKLYSYQY
jgi:hypothetical protein